MNRWYPLSQLFLARLRGFYREPEVLFWVYGFPIMLAIVLGLAFMRREPQPPDVDVQETPGITSDAAALAERLHADGLPVELHSEAECRQRLRTGKTALFVIPGTQGYQYVYDPARDESLRARYRVDGVIQRWKSGGSGWPVEDQITDEPGSRYIDFLMPGLMGMNLMGGGMFGVGFLVVDLRVRKLLKRLLATPMRRGDFLLSILGARLVFLWPEMLTLLLVAVLGYGVPIQGNWLTLGIVILTGAIAFSGIGLLVGCRTERTETASGLMNAIMLPQWAMSGIFFSSKHFPALMQPLVQALPLTQLIDALREVMLEGAPLAAIGWRLLILVAYAAITFFLALKWFRWQ
jgi:ABC-type multidrug transport system permease subunit